MASRTYREIREYVAELGMSVRKGDPIEADMLRAYAEEVRVLHHMTAFSESPTISTSGALGGTIYDHSQNLLKAAIAAAYPELDKERVYDIWVDCNESIAYCAKRAKEDMEDEARFAEEDRIQAEKDKAAEYAKNLARQAVAAIRVEADKRGLPATWLEAALEDELRDLRETDERVEVDGMPTETDLSDDQYLSEHFRTYGINGYKFDNAGKAVEREMTLEEVESAERRVYGSWPTDGNTPC